MSSEITILFRLDRVIKQVNLTSNIDALTLKKKVFYLWQEIVFGFFNGKKIVWIKVDALLSCFLSSLSFLDKS